MTSREYCHGDMVITINLRERLYSQSKRKICLLLHKNSWKKVEPDPKKFK